MNATHLHLMLTHFPLVGLGFALMINLYANFRKNPEIRKLSLWIYVMVGVTSLLAYFTGDGAEEVIKTYPGITEDMIEPHEHFALVFFIGIMVISCLSVFGLYYSTKKESFLKKINLYTVILAVILCIFAVETAITGGNIRHSEIKNGSYKELKSK